MTKRMNKLFLLLTVAIMISAQSFAGIWKPIVSEQPTNAATELISTSENSTVITFKLNGFFMNPVKTDNGDAYTISVPNAGTIMEEGEPDLPKLTASVAISDLALMDVEITSSNFIEYQNIEIAPSKGNIFRDKNPNEIPYRFGRAYQTNDFYPKMLSNLDNPFIIRDVRGQAISVYPFQYNPVTKVLRVYTEITVNIYKVNNQGYNQLIRNSNQQNGINSDYKSIYESAFINYSQPKYTPINETGKMLIISHPSFMDAMKPFIEWKQRTGMKVEMVSTATSGTTAAAIKTYVANYYNSNSDFAFLLLVGDAPQIPTNKGGGLGGPSDHAYGYIVGNDHYADILVGRFSCETEDHVKTMVNRTIEYEKNPNMSKDWFSNGTGIASQEGPGLEGMYDYQYMRTLRDKLLAYTYTNVSEYYEGSQGGLDAAGNPTPSQISTEVNNGTSIMNYCGHGDNTLWVTSGFSNSDINNLSNNGFYPFIWSVACVNGNFEGLTCFAEAWTRAKNANGPTGAVAALMSTINQSWTPPMHGQREMVDILTEKYPNNIKRTFGGLSLNGMFKMIEANGAGGESMADTWLIFGDPSVMVRTKKPVNITATHDNQIFIGTSTFKVNSPVNQAKVAMTSKAGEILATGLIANGSVNLNFTPFTMPDTVKLTITAYNHIPYLADVAVIPNEGPYVIYNSVTVNDITGINNNKADYGDTVNVNLKLVNIGVEPASNVTVTITSTDEFINILDGTAVIQNFNAGDTLVIENEFVVRILENIPDLHKIDFNFSAKTATDEWKGAFSITGYAGIFSYVSYSIDDSQTGNNNGRLDPGEEGYLKITLKNTGHSEIYNAYNQISFNDPYLTIIDSPEVLYGDISPTMTATKGFKVKASDDAPLGEIVSVNFLASAKRNLKGEGNFNLFIGQAPIIIIDMDGNKNSGPAIKAALEANNIVPIYTTTFPTVFENYNTVFVCLGIGSNRHVLTNPQGQMLANFVNAGGNLYMEGGDTWKKDPKTSVHSLFNLVGIVDGSADLDIQVGEASTFAEGLSLKYTGDNESIDHIAAKTPAYNLFKNSNPLYFTAVANVAADYKTLASVFEFGGLTDVDFPSTKNEYMRRLLEFFEIGKNNYVADFIGTPVQVMQNKNVEFIDFSTEGTTSWRWTFEGGTPATSTEQNPVVKYSELGKYDVTLIVTNGTNTDTLIKKDYIEVTIPINVDNVDAAIVNCYPNPANSVVNFDMKGFDNNVNVIVFNSNGQAIYKANDISANEKLELNVSNWQPGLYVAKISSNSKTTQVKFTVVR